MARLKGGEKAPDFVLDDFRGREVRLSGVLEESNVLLVFNRGFA